MSALGLGQDHAVIGITYVGDKFRDSLCRSFLTYGSSLTSIPRVPFHVTDGMAFCWLFQSLKPLTNL